MTELPIEEETVVELSLLQDLVERLVVDLSKAAQSLRQTSRSLPRTMPYANVKAGITTVKGDIFHMVENLGVLLNTLDGLQGRVTCIVSTEEEEE